MRRFPSLTAVVILATALGGCGRSRQADIPALIDDLKSTDAETRGKASAALVDAGAPAVPALIEMLQGADPAHRAIAASTLYGMGGRGKAAVPALAVVLSADPDPQTRASAAMALENMGPDAAEGVPALIQALKDREGLVVQRAIIALGKIGPAARDAVPALAQAARSDSVRQSAEEAIQKIQSRQ